jgi:hypothetical protein
MCTYNIKMENEYEKEKGLFLKIVVSKNKP